AKAGTKPDVLGTTPVQYVENGMKRFGNTGTTIPDVPQPGPLVVPPQVRAMMVNPLTAKMGQQMYDVLKANKDQEWKRYNANVEMRKLQLEQGKSPLNPDGSINQNILAAEAEKKRVEIEAQEKGRTNALFGGRLEGTPDELRKRVNPELLAVTESMQAGRTPMKDVSTTRTGGGISFGKNDVQALGEKLFGDK